MRTRPGRRRVAGIRMRRLPSYWRMVMGRILAGMTKREEVGRG
jgi:hypothetical protein